MINEIVITIITSTITAATISIYFLFFNRRSFVRKYEFDELLDNFAALQKKAHALYMRDMRTQKELNNEALAENIPAFISQLPDSIISRENKEAFTKIISIIPRPLLQEFVKKYMK